WREAAEPVVERRVVEERLDLARRGAAAALVGRVEHALELLLLVAELAGDLVEVREELLALLVLPVLGGLAAVVEVGLLERAELGDEGAELALVVLRAGALQAGE